MIVVQVGDPILRKAVRRAAHAEEDVIADSRLVGEAVSLGFPRLIVRDDNARPLPGAARVPSVELDAETLRRWEVERRTSDLPLTRLDFSVLRLAILLEPHPSQASWVDTALADLTRAAGAQLPAPLRGFARRIFEFPVHYRTLHSVADACGLSRGALKAKFRRRGMASPYTYLRWFRIMAVANLLSDRSVTVADAARRMGFTSDGNLCRMVAQVAGMTPTEARTLRGWNRLLIGFAWSHLDPASLEAWAGLDDLFLRRIA